MKPIITGSVIIRSPRSDYLPELSVFNLVFMGVSIWTNEFMLQHMEDCFALGPYGGDADKTKTDAV